MNVVAIVMRRQVLRLAAFAVIVIAMPQFAWAMGPTSAPLKSSGAPPPADNTVPKPHHHVKHRHAGSAMPK
jgi:hypothetical protein